jgi:hypothetical protein
MNDEHRAIVARAIDKGQRAINALRLESAARDVTGEIESYEDELAMLRNEAFMDGVFESWEAIKRGEKGTPGRELKRKYKRA